jgi:hypothetical protein
VRSTFKDPSKRRDAVMDDTTKKAIRDETMEWRLEAVPCAISRLRFS